MKPKLLIGIGLPLLLGLVLLVAGTAQAMQSGDPTRGAMLYDNWFALLGVDAPPGDMPLWSSQSANTRSGPDTWRCVRACQSRLPNIMFQSSTNFSDICPE